MRTHIQISQRKENPTEPKYVVISFFPKKTVRSNPMPKSHAEAFQAEFNKRYPEYKHTVEEVR